MSALLFIPIILSFATLTSALRNNGLVFKVIRKRIISAYTILSFVFLTDEIRV